MNLKCGRSVHDPLLVSFRLMTGMKDVCLVGDPTVLARSRTRLVESRDSLVVAVGGRVNE